MNWKDKIILTLEDNLKTLGFQYIKSITDFKRIVDKKTIIYLGLIVDRFHHGYTDVSFFPAANYRDIEEVQYQLLNLSLAKHGHLRVGSRVEWLMPQNQYTYGDLDFKDDDDKINNKKLDLLLYRLKTYALPYMERLSHKDSAIEEAIPLDLEGILWAEGTVPIMYCLWKHDKNAALDFIEKKRQVLLERVEPWEWERLERFKNGERFGGMEQIKNGVRYGVNNPLNAYAYDEFMGFVSRFNEWLETQNL